MCASVISIAVVHSLYSSAFYGWLETALFTWNIVRNTGMCATVVYSAPELDCKMTYSMSSDLWTWMDSLYCLIWAGTLKTQICAVLSCVILLLLAGSFLFFKGDFFSWLAEFTTSRNGASTVNILNICGRFWVKVEELGQNRPEKRTLLVGASGI
jgi:hypothetical protein